MLLTIYQATHHITQNLSGWLVKHSDVDEAIAPVQGELSANASAICTANAEFQEQLSVAQAEINTLKAELENSKREASTDPLAGLYN